MKRAAASLILIALFVFGLSSCKGGEKCPTYSKVEQSSELPA